MAEKQETIEDIIAEMRRDADADDITPDCILGQKLNYLANRLEAVHKRELRESVTNCNQLNAAKLREAMKRIVAASIVAKNANAPEWILQRMADIFAMATTALASPLRNCDIPLVVDGPADNNADKAWLVFKRHNPEAYFDVPGLLRCIDWLLAPATEKEREVNKSIHVDDWRYPLTNISQCGGKGHRVRPTAAVMDADGSKLLLFCGAPYRENMEAIAMATEFCATMNAAHKCKEGGTK